MARERDTSTQFVPLLTKFTAIAVPTVAAAVAETLKPVENV